MNNFAGPVFRMNRSYQYFVGVKRQDALVHLSFCIVVVGKALSLHPSQKTPLSRCLSALHSSLNRIHDGRIIPGWVVEDIIPRLRALEGKWLAVFVGYRPRAFAAGIARKVLAGVDGRRRRETAVIDVVGPAPPKLL